MNMTILTALFAGMAVTFGSYCVIILIAAFTGRYKEKYVKETAVEADEILLNIPPEKVLDISLALSVVVSFISVLIFGFYVEQLSWGRMAFLAILSAAAVFPIPRFILRVLKKQRLKKFNEQLEDALLSMSSSLKAGFSINQALEVVAAENRKPISYEFNILIQELRLGVSLDEALNKMSSRLNCQDFELVAVSIITARQTGGELTSTLERLAAVIRERVRITGRIQALTAQGRMQAVIIGLMPIALFFAMLKIAPDMMNSFFSSVTGILCLIAVLVLDITGFLVIRKITHIDI